MRIGIDIRTLMDKQYSGVSKYTLALVKEILRQDQVNEYYLYYNSWRDLSERLPKFDQSNVKVVRTRYPNKIFNYFLEKIFHYPKIDKLLGGVDVFWAPHINFLSLSKNCRKIITIHDLSFLRFREFFSWRKNIWHRALNVKKLVKKFDLVIAVSKNTKEDVAELLSLPEQKIKVIYSGINPRYESRITNQESERVRKKYNLPENFILFLGTIEPRKNIVGLIEAYNQFRSQASAVNCQKLILAGGWGWNTDKIKEEWQKSPYKDDIIFLGYVDNDDKPALYQLACLFVYPSFYEGFGFPPLEAMASGTPVIASFASSLPEVIGGTGIIVDPNNTNDLARAMAEVATNHNLRDNLIKKGLKQVERFSWEKASREYLNLLNFD